MCNVCHVTRSCKNQVLDGLIRLKTCMPLGLYRWFVASPLYVCPLKIQLCLRYCLNILKRTIIGPNKYKLAPKMRFPAFSQETSPPKEICPPFPEGWAIFLGISGDEREPNILGSLQSRPNIRAKKGPNIMAKGTKYPSKFSPSQFNFYLKPKKY